MLISQIPTGTLSQRVIAAGMAGCEHVPLLSKQKSGITFRGILLALIGMVFTLFAMAGIGVAILLAAGP